MNKFNLHYAHLELDGDIPCYEFDTHFDMMEFISEKLLLSKDFKRKVFLISKDGSSDIFISDKIVSTLCFLENMIRWQLEGVYFLQEYPSFEDAHSVALDILENEELRFNQ